MKPLWGSLFSKPLERKDAVTRRASAGPVFAFAGTPYNPHWDLDRTIKDAYERVLWVNRIVDARSIACARLDAQVRSGDGPDAKPVNHRINYLLNKRANRYETGKGFRYRLHAQFQLSKKGVFVEVILDQNHGEIAELHLLNPLYTTVLPDPDTFVLGFEVRTPSGEVSTLRPWDPENPRSNTILWIRKTHPFDPYASATWLDAAGLSIDLDHYARLYNRTFMQNDGRPGGLLAVSAEIEPEEADKLQARLSGGVGAAGKITVIGDADKVKYVDTSTSPRDAQYVESRAITKGELLVAGGTPLSVIGDASGRTFDNADAEEEMWWRQTNIPDLEIIGPFFDLLTGQDNDLAVSYDLSVVAVLQREATARAAQAQTEWDKGLITLDEYREATGKPPIGVPAARANWMVAGKTPIAKQTDFDAIQAAYGGGGAPPGGAPQPPGGPPSLLGATTTPGGPAPSLPPGMGGGTPPGAPGAPGGAPQAISRSSAPAPIEGPRTLRELVASKALPAPAETKATKASVTIIDDAHLKAAGDAAYAAQQATLDAVATDLQALYDNFGQAVAARLGNANSRKHTRHWTGKINPGMEVKVIDAGKIVDIARWVGTFTDALVQAIIAAFGGAALDVATGLDWRPGDAGEAAAAEALRAAAAQVYAGDIIEHIRDHFTARTGRLERVVREADESGATIAGIVDRVSEAMLESPAWADSDSRAVVGAMNAGGLSGATMAGATEKLWLATPDERTRPTHADANGQVVGIGKAFKVGEAELQYPGDPTTTHLEEIINCRCSQAFRVGARTADTFDAQLGEDLAGLDAYEAVPAGV